MNGTSRKTLAALILSAITLTLVGCAPTMSVPVAPPTASIFTSIQAPLDTDFDETQISNKSGRASTIWILGIVATGDASIKAAAVNGGISEVQHADYHYLNVLGVFAKFTTIVYGK